MRGNDLARTVRKVWQLVGLWAITTRIFAFRILSAIA